MIVYVYPADLSGCGHFRMIWPAVELQRQGFDVRIVRPQDRHIEVAHHKITGQVLGASWPRDADVIVFQRLSHKLMAGVVPLMRQHGCAVVIDLDDNLAEIDPRNAAHAAFNQTDIELGHHWRHTDDACKMATLVTCSTPALARRYGRPGAVRVVPNTLPGFYYGLPHADNGSIVWPATVDTHPGDGQITAGAIQRVLQEHPECWFASVCVDRNRETCREAFGLAVPPIPLPPVDVMRWPSVVATAGIGIAPLEQSTFSAGKSWLKPLEMMAVGVPWVASSTSPEYRMLAKQSKVGLLAGTPADWYRQVSRLASNPQLREDQSEAGRAAAQRYRMADHAHRWWEAWQAALRIQRGSRKAARQPVHIA